MIVENFIDKHKGEKCFIYGSGPSLRDVDTKPLERFVSISVNAGIVKAPFSDYFVSDDAGVTKWDFYYKTLQRRDVTKFLFRDKFKSVVTPTEENQVVLFDHTWWYSPENDEYNMEGIKLKKAEPIIGAATSAGSAIHLAYIMGCSSVYLLGFDCCFYDNKKYFWQFWEKDKHPKMVKKNYRVPLCGKHSNPVKGKYVNDYYSFFMKYWDDIVDVNKDLINGDFPIINCSDGALESFEKKTIEEVLNEL